MGVALLLIALVVVILWLVWFAPLLMTAFIEAIASDEDDCLDQSDVQRWTRDD